VAEPLRGDVLLVQEVKVESDAWVVVHPAAAGGGPDASTPLGRSFVMHGTTERVAVDLDAPAAPGATLYVMLHDDTSEIGRFEFAGAGTADQPLVQGGSPVVQSFVVE
jgi:hypothetical protein